MKINVEYVITKRHLTKGIVMLFGAVLWGALLILPLFSRAGICTVDTYLLY